ncbi:MULTISPECIES: GH25 family lysozyme [unclassified Sphingomonas]|uniref:GH25 family lysozyme n=1 Tax=unclassified Sphingomonas TaxID=196159 RepID=UPI00285D14E8|nr:GH25 family lysozyme [Sphingomonas sp. SORGH_AS_0870]MDR6147404.1 lysozyme [Sphingomonas sp. SORGH_AS_0870]
MAILWKIGAGLLALGAAGMGGWHWATHWRPSADHYALQGIDLAENPPPVEWRTLRAGGADFAYIVATSGADRRDPAFEANWAALPEAGLRRGAVHIYSLCQPAAAQADAFNIFVPRAGDALPAAIDLSFHDDCTARPDRATLVADLTRFVTMVETHTRKPVMLRVAKPFESEYSITTAFDRPIWAVGNMFKPDYAARPWRMWRASDFRRVEGVEGPVNWDVVTP